MEAKTAYWAASAVFFFIGVTVLGVTYAWFHRASLSKEVGTPEQIADVREKHRKAFNRGLIGGWGMLGLAAIVAVFAVNHKDKLV